MTAIYADRVRPAVLLAVGLAVLALFPPVCAHGEGQAVKAGDEAAVHFTCRLPNGDIAASSYKSVAENAALKKSPVFWQRTVNDPIAITAGRPSGTDAAERHLEDEILYRLANLILGFRPGEARTLEVRADRRPEETSGEYVQKVACVRWQIKEVKIAVEAYTSRMGKPPEVGQPFALDPAVPGKVASVTENEVVVRFSLEPGSKVPTPFGEGTVKELPDRYEITIHAHPGDLVRTGGYVGRITSVDDKFITIDYSHPFGGEALQCDVLVESVKPGRK